ncbi:murein L,D-transpeptidase family protein [Prosthecobacter sp.]|uniref:L,D-transpeptidase family protein n=1 Tax=Prosthecobacter sp. TaxID=1965333 RepID=UPI002ABBE580|nr:murein L,D-transpeptidase family protein [Prosthecobacter sp.]MDZ4404807.1 murein L,D-transpeptidase family protein [Prosthecobacter sp.]
MQIITRDRLSLPYAPPPPPEQWQPMNAADRLANVRSRLLPKVHDELAAKQLKLGQPAFIRIFKESRELELWLQTNEGWQLFRNYPIATFSGTLGPKTREGDMQAPEGFYSVTKSLLNAASSYHLSFNIGYPNTYDLAHQRTGSLIMVHGNVVSIGCFAMTDPLIEEIYLIVDAALNNSETVPVHSFPFRMTEARLKSADPKHLDFWRNLQTAHDLFEKDHRVPQITVANGRYTIQPRTAN